ncbi:phospholipid/cholesterol/gamma-HCH transport system ATP-binding protein [Actinokineospora baliensis]|uniref:ABC transporter ATP-binding protein n=1 Tax=Actinokineospora baliensis TaxID=547056 RepID=UPI001956599F|nr:ATP-binding cassette domain-containing protein [Actinokineospora baliensis]MBM7773522.1 phospholipid/cholesterol/gamma-HCH transport system ATP-binding protein [Actinokineospora baliensis]
MGVEVVVEGLGKSFGTQAIWRDVTLTLPAGEVSVLLGPSGTGKSVFLKCLIGLLRPERGRVLINGVDLCSCAERDTYEIRKLFGVLFQDGALFGSMSVYDNIAFPLREHTRKSEKEVRAIVMSTMDKVGMRGAEHKLPAEISGGMRKRAGLARALVLDPHIILCDEPDSGLDPVRTALLSQLLIDLNAQTDATILIVTHNTTVARTVPDNLGMLFRKELVVFGPRELLLTTDIPVVSQFLNGHKEGPIGMSEENDTPDAGPTTHSGPHEITPQLPPTPGLPPRAAVRRRKLRLLRTLDTLPAHTRTATLATMTPEDLDHYETWRRRTSAIPFAGGPQ